MLLVISAGVFWGTSGTLGAFAPEGATSMTIGAVRAFGSGLALTLLMLARGPRNFFKGPWPILPVLISGFGLALYQPVFFASAQATGAGVAAVITVGSAPAMAGLMGRVFFGERLSFKWCAATITAIGGGALLASGGLSGSGAIDPGGALLAVVAGFAYSLEGLGVKMIGDKRDSVEATTAIFMTSGIMALPFLLTRDAAWIFTGRGIAISVALGVLSSALPYIFFNRGLLTVGIARSYTLTLSEPLTACLLSAFILGQRLSLTAMIGVAVICGAIALLAADTKAGDEGEK